MNKVVALKAPFPYFGGKSRVASLVWRRFGDVPNYVEPFAGSLAVLLGRPTPPGTETVNDIDCYLSNFWRALRSEPDEVARWAHWPINEADLHARHAWLVRQDEFRERMKADPQFYDVKVAGWWVWGLCAWIGSGWCSESKYVAGSAGRGVNRQLPHLGDAGQGVNRKLPHLGDAGRGELLLGYFEAIATRLERVRVCCGDWTRVLGPSVTTKHGLTAVFLDPPYSDTKRAGRLYANDDLNVAKLAREWAVSNGNDPLLRIALCGYEGEYEMPEGWSCVAWKAKGGYSSQRRGDANLNPERERIWFSPHCLSPAKGARQRSLFSEET